MNLVMQRPHLATQSTTGSRFESSTGPGTPFGTTNEPYNFGPDRISVTDGNYFSEDEVNR